MISSLVSNLILHVVLNSDGEVDEIISEDDGEDTITIMIENWVEYLFN